MNFKQYFLLKEISQKQVDEVQPNNIKLPWDNIFGNKLRIKIDYIPDYSFLGTDEIIYVKDKKAFFKSKDDRQKNVLKLSKAVDKKDEVSDKEIKQYRESLANIVKTKFSEHPEEMRALTYHMRIPVDVIIDEIREDGFKATFDVVMRQKQEVREILVYIFPNIRELFKAEDDYVQNKKDFSLIKNSTEKYTLVLSRAPIDVLRASDYKNIQSCMSPKQKLDDVPGIHYKDLCQNVKTGAGIVYILPELNISDSDLQSPEIFKDVERQIEGHSPVARILIRQFINNTDNKEVMVPEVRIFGSMAENLKKIAYTEIVKKIKDIQQVTTLDPEEWQMVGSTYIDYEYSPEKLLDIFNKI